MAKYLQFLSASDVCAVQKGELHHFVIWEHGRHKQDEIIQDIQQHFTILDCFDIQWDRDTVCKSFSRLYGQGNSSGVRRLRERGGGRFLLITVWDENPVYGIAEALSGHEVVNTTMLNLKKKYRGWVNRSKGNCIHSSTRPAETNHDLTLLLGKNTEDYLDTVKQPWDGQFKQLNQNMLGAKGWKNIEETFYALNNTVNYAVLRNFEVITGGFNPKLHGDIDILTADREKILSILNPYKKPAPLYCPNKLNSAKVRIGDRSVSWDIRHVGDNYYCTDWQNDMLKRKVFNPNGFYCLDDENYFFSLVYHALIHKYRIAPDYYDKTRLLFDRLQLDKPTGNHAFPSDFDLYFNLLRSFMKRKGYFFIKPCHPRVGYNKVVLASIPIAEQLTAQYGLTDVEPVKVNQYQLASQWIKKDCNIYFQGFLNGRKVFIKTNGYAETKKSEYRCSLKCFQSNRRNFLEPLFYYEGKNIRCVATEYIEGETLDVLLQENRLSLSEKKNIILQLKDIAQTLCDAKIAHRDLVAHNLLITPEGHVKLFDFGWSVEIDNYKECRVIREHPLLFARVCREHTPSWLVSDDIYRLLAVLKSVGLEKEYEEEYRQVETRLSSLMGRNAVKFKHPYSYIFQYYRRRLLKTSLFFSKNLMFVSAWRTKFRRWVEKQIYYID